LKYPNKAGNPSTRLPAGTEDRRTQAKNREEESTMISKTFRIAGMIILASFALSSAAWATCSNASLSGTYGLLHGGTDRAGQPTTAIGQLRFDPTTGTYTGVDTSSHDGVITTMPVTGTYTVASNCIVEANALGENIAFVVTSTGFF
jgi:hypothetical protein